jgi:hypothetical protein
MSYRDYGLIENMSLTVGRRKNMFGPCFQEGLPSTVVRCLSVGAFIPAGTKYLFRRLSAFVGGGVFPFFGEEHLQIAVSIVLTRSVQIVNLPLHSKREGDQLMNESRQSVD